MNLEERIHAFSQLGDFLKQTSDLEFVKKLKEAEIKNHWFTLENQKKALKIWANQLTIETLKAWLTPYDLKEQDVPKNVLVIMAGNIPLVGFNDFVSVLITGNNVIVKMSSDDNVLLAFIAKKLIAICPEFKERVQFIEEFKDKKLDAVIATGSDLSAKYFNYYFRNTKKIIRKNRNSVSILDGTESKSELKLLAKDVFSYFGLGCRNISKVFLPKRYDLDQLFEAFYSFRDIIEHKKYANNYDYNKAIFLMGDHQIIDNGFFLLKEDKSLQSPLAMLYYEYYSNKAEVENFLAKNKHKLQCVVSKNHITFGETQNPNLWDYADEKDTIEFLVN